jgi:steroid delta-isomerase-like uncharacterized protein
MSEQNKAIASRLLDALWNKQDFTVVDELVPEDYDGHSSTEIHGPEGAKAFASMLRMAFPDFQFAIEDQIAEGDRVVTRWSGGGTHSGEFLGAPATGNYITLTGLTIFRIVDGKLRDGWTNEDLLGFMTQLGAVPEIPR